MLAYFRSGLAWWVGLLLATAQGPHGEPSEAAKQEDWAALSALLDAGADPDAAHADGSTALHWAVYHDDADSVTRLLAAGADAGAANRYGVTAITLAATNGNVDIVRALLKAGSDPNARLRGGETTLMIAARTGKLAPVEALLARDAEVDAHDRRGQTALMWAAAEGHAPVVTRLIDAGADAFRHLPSGFTAWFFAAREGRAEVVRTLLEAGVGVNDVMKHRRRQGRGPLPGSSALCLAVENGHFELATMLLEAGADPNDQRSGYTPLHILTWVRKPNRGDGEDGMPPPTGSGNMSSLQFAEALVEHGADVDTRLEKGSSGGGHLGTKGATAFLMAAKTADVSFLRLLIDLEADPALSNADNCTPLMAAAGVGTLAPTEEAGTEEEALEAAAFILELGADPNHVDANGETAMHGAAYKSLPKMVHFLAERSAEIDIWNRKNARGWTPLLIAQGFRPGNFKPSVPTIEALSQVMLEAGVTPPDPPDRKAPGERTDYQP